MNLRRGLLFAGIHLAVAIPLLVWEEATHWDWLRQREIHPIQIAKAADGDTISFSPCGLWENYTATRTVIMGADTPAVALSGWQLCAPPRWSVAKFAGATVLNSTRAIEMKACIGLCVCIVLQWFLLGSFPLKGHAKWYTEPGAFITVCTVASTALLALFGSPSLIEQARAPAPHLWYVPNDLIGSVFPSLFAAIAWCWWFGLLLWTLARAAWRLLRRKPETQPA
jgi:hypothetical protein